MLDKTQAKHREHLQVLRNSKLGARSASRAGHRSLVRAQNIHQLLRDHLPRVLQLMAHSLLNSLGRQERRHSDLIRASVQLREVVRRGERECDDTDSSLAFAVGIEDSCLEDDEGLGEILVDLDFDGVRLVLGDDGHGEQVG